MITKFKIFEHINEQPKIGDYVLIDSSQADIISSTYKNFYGRTIGQIVDIKNEKNGKYEVMFDENVNGQKISNFHFFNFKFIKYWSDNKEDLEPYIRAKKYNL